jgi:hypothetical protein
VTSRPGGGGRARSPPPRRPADLRPVAAEVPAGARWLRLVRAAHRDPLGVGPAPSRFSDPALDRGRPPRWLPLYLGASFTLCLQEALLRDRAVGAPPGPFLVAEAELALWDRIEAEALRPLRVVDLRGAALARSRVPTDVVGAADQRLARAWAAAFHRHPARFDGVLFPSRFRTGDNLALFQPRAAGALGVVSRRGVLDDPVELGRACVALDLAIVPAAPDPEDDA